MRAEVEKEGIEAEVRAELMGDVAQLVRDATAKARDEAHRAKAEAAAARDEAAAAREAAAAAEQEAARLAAEVRVVWWQLARVAGFEGVDFQRVARRLQPVPFFTQSCSSTAPPFTILPDPNQTRSPSSRSAWTRRSGRPRSRGRSCSTKSRQRRHRRRSGGSASSSSSSVRKTRVPQMTSRSS